MSTPIEPIVILTDDDFKRYVVQALAVMQSSIDELRFAVGQAASTVEKALNQAKEIT